MVEILSPLCGLEVLVKLIVNGPQLSKGVLTILARGVGYIIMV
jgi:hypothetical protein